MPRAFERSIFAFAISSLLLVSSAGAQPILKSPGRVLLVDARAEIPIGASLVGIDAQGHVYFREGPTLVCFDPRSPTMTRRAVAVNTDPVPYTYVSMSQDRTHAIAVAYHPASLSVTRMRCGGVDASFTVTGPTLSSRGPLTSAGYTAETPAGDVCFGFLDAIRCYDAAGRNTRSFEVEAARALIPEPLALDADPVPLSQANSTVSVPVPEPETLWFFGPFTVTPSGSLFALATRDSHDRTTMANGRAYRWMVEQTAQGTVRLRSGAIPERTDCFREGQGLGLQTNPLRGVTRLIYHPGLDSVLAFPVVNWDLRLQRETVLGVRVFPIAEPGHGYLSFTEPYRAVGGLDQDSGTSGLEVRPSDGRLVLTVMLPSGSGFGVKQALHEVDMDVDDLDLDFDGLRRSEETRRGTSDVIRDSDFGGTTDGDEVLIGDDPADPLDDLARRMGPARVEYAASPLLQMRLPGSGGRRPVEPRLFGAEQIGERAPALRPWCKGGRCVGPSGELVLTYDPSTTPTNQPVSQDGRFLLEHAGGRFTAVRFADGSRRELGTDTEVEPLLVAQSSGDSWQSLAVGENEVYVWKTYGPRIVLIGDGPPRVVFDLFSVRCDSGWGCDRTPGMGLGALGWSVIGYDDVLERLLLTANEPATRRRLVVGVHRSELPAVLVRPEELHNTARDGFAFDRCFTVPDDFTVPSWGVSTGHGDLVVDGSVTDPFFRQLRSWFYGFGTPPFRMFDGLGTLIDSEQQLLELVRYEEGSFEPGDVLSLLRRTGSVNEDVRLYRSGPRGGIAILLDENLFQLHVTGMSVARDGRICLADRSRGEVLELERVSGPDGVRELSAQALSVGGEPIHCGYAPDGSLRVLMADAPARILSASERTASRAFTERTLEGALGRTPVQLLVRDDGTEEVLYLEEPTLGIGRALDGATLRLDATTLTIPGQAPGPGALEWFNSTTTPSQPPLTPSDISGLKVHLVQRPDGLVVGLFYSPEKQALDRGPRGELLVYDPRTGQRGLLAPQPSIALGSNNALAIFPGGQAADPWTGQPIPGLTPPPPDAGVPEGDGGTVSSEDGDTGGCGCSTTQERQAGSFLVPLAILGWLATRASIRDGRRGRRRLEPRAAP